MRCLTVAGTTLAGLTIATALGSAALAEPVPSAGLSPSPAQSEPQPAPSNGEVDNQNPVAGGTVVVTGHGFQPAETVSFDANTESARAEAVTHLATAQADAAGDATATVRIPAGFTGQLPIKLTGQTSGVTVTVAVTVAPGRAAAMPGLPVTGPGALAYTAAGLAFVVGGAAFVTIARLRRTAHVAAHASR
ncbi:hypothetical protein ACQP2P_39330 [Dactylosporangium sp. CA-139114]|uniref:hypothetical protein n=1 Tax=Dactylosporangium sp. CA-139114 TaxID=3239931 RepID=UPI003D95DB61